jgi:hypothetical protein
MADMFDKEELGIVSSLFGVSPAMRNKAMQDVAYKRGTEAGQNLLGAAIGQTGMFAEQARQGLSSSLGVQSPEDRMAAIRQQAQQQFDTNTPEGLLQMADFLNSQGDAAGARQAVMLAQGQQARVQKIATDRATEQAKLREKDPEIVRIQGIRDQLEEKFGPNDRRVIELNKVIEGKAKGQGTTINIDQKGQTAFEQGLGAEDAKRVANAEKIIESAAGTLGTLKKMAEVNQMGVIGGTGSAARIEALKFLDTAGFTTPKEKTTLASSENFNKLTGDLILERIKQLGTNPSNADRDFIAKIVPQLESSALARKQLIEYMADKANQIVDEATKLSTYGRENRGLKGYKPTIPLVNTTLPTKNISQYSVQELEDMLKNAKPAGAK